MLMTINCAVVDDEPLALELIASYVDKTPFLNLVGSYSSAVAALEAIAKKRVQLLFLDIQMPELSGLELSKMVNPDEVRIIFTTAFSQYAVESYRVNALDYLLKPISYPDFLSAAQKALSALTAAAPAKPVADEFIYVKTDYKLVQIAIADILYIEGLKDYVKIWLEGNPAPILSIISMKSLEEHLPPDRFIRVHRSFIVQKSKITTVDRSRIVFGKQYIPISDTYKEAFQAYIASRSL